MMKHPRMTKVFEERNTKQSQTVGASHQKAEKLNSELAG